MMSSYFAYGLGIHSDFPVPAFVEGDSPRDVVIRIDPDEASSGSLEGDVALDATLSYNHVAVFRVRAGREIFVKPAPRADLDLIRMYLVGMVMATLLYQRGLLVLHAGAVEVDGLAVAFAGDSGFGKSSAVAALHSRGFRVIADDVTAINTGTGVSRVPMAIPAYPQVKVDPTVARLFGYDEDALVQLHPAAGKRGLRVTDGFDKTPVPLGLIYLLQPDAVEESLPLRPQGLLIELVRSSFPARVRHSGGATHLRQCASLAKSVPFMGLARCDARVEPATLENRVRRDLDFARANASYGLVQSVPEPVGRFSA